jgi:hypothetical protein
VTPQICRPGVSHKNLMNSTVILDDYLATHGCDWGEDICDVYTPADEDFLREYADALSCPDALPRCDAVTVSRVRRGRREKNDTPTRALLRVALSVALGVFLLVLFIRYCRRRFQCGRLYQ